MKNVTELFKDLGYENYHLESNSLTFDLVFHGQKRKTDGRYLHLSHENEKFHPHDTALLRKTIKCHSPECPKDNFTWISWENRVPLISKGFPVPNGWWHESIKKSVKRIEFFKQEILERELSNLFGYILSDSIYSKLSNLDNFTYDKELNETLECECRMGLFRSMMATINLELVVNPNSIYDSNKEIENEKRIKAREIHLKYYNSYVKDSQDHINDINERIDKIIANRFSKDLLKPKWQKISGEKLHNILWHMFKTGDYELRIYDLVISPPQKDYTTEKAHNRLRKDAQTIFNRSGGWGAWWTEHHVRIKSRYNDPESEQFLGSERECNETGFHFHLLAFGFFNYEQWENSGWIIKNLSYNPHKHYAFTVESPSSLIQYNLSHASVIKRKPTISLSCESAEPTETPYNSAYYETTDTGEPLDQYGYPIDQNDTDLIAQTNVKFEDQPITSPTNETNGFQSTTVRKPLLSKEKSHIKKVYWFTGCLSDRKFKLPKEKKFCPINLEDIKENGKLIFHEIKKGDQVPCTVYKKETIHIEPTSKNLEKYELKLEFAQDFAGFGQDCEKEKEQLDKLKNGELWAEIQTKIEPENYDQHLHRHITKMDRILIEHFGTCSDIPRIVNGYRYLVEQNGSVTKDLKWAYLNRLRDPNYAWFLIPHDSEKYTYEIDWRSLMDRYTDTE
ncbi:MAG: hypothetical protein ACYCPR_03930 [Thermoplasmataceae archaeon]